MKGFEFSHATRRVIFGAGSFAWVPDILHAHATARTLVVLDGYFADHPLAERIKADLPGVTCWSIPHGEPTEASVVAVAKTLTDLEPDAVLALGGGSTIDTAKAALMLAANPGPLMALCWPEARITRAHPALFVAAATTAGSGSEVSETAIVDIPGTVYKAHMRSPYLAPQVSILDPELGLTVPRYPTLTSGFDALTHAVEAYTSRAANPMTDPLAMSATRLIFDNLARAADDPCDVNARAACLLGSAQAGIAFNSAHLGIAHAIAGALGALHHVPHGLANALALPWTMVFNRPELMEKDAVLADLFKADSAAEGISRLRHAVGLDRSLNDYIPAVCDLDKVAAAAMTSGQIRMNPRAATQTDIRKILSAMQTQTGGHVPRL